MGRIGKFLLRLLGVAAALIAVAALALYIWLPHPTRDAAVLSAIRAESFTLMATHPVKPDESAEIPQSQWPATIASLHPYSVTVVRWGVHIGIKPYMDLGWGYGIPRNEAARKELIDWCFGEAGQGVLWHAPC